MSESTTKGSTVFKFNDHTTVEKLEVVPENFRVFYEKNAEDGAEGFNLKGSEEVKAAVAALTGLNSSLTAARAEAAGMKGKATDLSALGEYGTDPESILAGINTRMEEVKAISKDGSVKDVERQLDKIKADLAKTNSQDLKQKDARIDALKNQLYEHLVDSQVISALHDSIDPEVVSLFIKKQVKVNELDGKYTVSVVDSAGDTRYSGTTGTPLTINELVDELKNTDKRKHWFKSKAPSGGGPPPGSSHQKVVGPRTGVKSSTEKISAGLKAGNATPV